MAFVDSFDTIREKAAEAAQLAARKTKQLAEIAKANLSIYAEEDKIKKAEAELGKLFYRDYVVDEELDMAEYLPWCQKIDESKQTIADLRDYIETLKTEHVDMPEVEDEETVEVEEEIAEDAVIEVVVCDDAEASEDAAESEAE